MTSRRPQKPKVKKESNPDLVYKKPTPPPIDEEKSNEDILVVPNEEDTVGDTPLAIPDKESTSEDGDFDLDFDDDCPSDSSPGKEVETPPEIIIPDEDFEGTGISDFNDEENSYPGSEADEIPQDPTQIEILYDAESSYFFMYGVRDAGKTVILSGLFYNLMAHRLGDNLKNLNDHTLDFQKRGTVLLDQLMESVPSGKFPKSTTTLQGESQIIPRQINLEFGPKNKQLPDFKFTMMDMSGEDLMKVKVGSDEDNEKLSPGIESFLSLPDNNLAFICVYPAESGLNNHQLSSYIRGFLDELDRLEHKQTPMIFIVSKWDLVKDKYETIEDFFLDRDPIVWNKICESDRVAAMMKFSIGDVKTNEDGDACFQYDPSNSNELFKWMYKTQMGVSLDEDLASKHGFSKFMGKIFGK